MNHIEQSNNNLTPEKNKLAAAQRLAQNAALDLSGFTLPAAPAPELQRAVFSAGAPELQPISAFPKLFREHGRFVREKYEALYNTPVFELANGDRTFDRAELIRRHGINALFLRGDRFEMAFQHGRLLSDEIARGAPYQATRLVRNAIANTIGSNEFLLSTASNTIHRFVTDKMVNYALRTAKTPDGEMAGLDEAVAMSDSTGIPMRTLIRALFAPEALLLLANKNNVSCGATVQLLPGVVPNVNNCSAFAAWGKHTRNGELILGRNMDFPLNGFYDEFPTVIYYEPTDGGQKYMTFVSSGVHNAGLNAYNESGLFLVSHTIPTDHMSTKGVPVFLTAGEVIRNAKTFDEAVELFKRYLPPTGWGYFLASTREGRFGTIELSNQKMAVREIDPKKVHHYVQTNHYLAPEMQSEHMFMNASVCEDNDGRLLRMRQCIMANDGTLDIKGGMKILSDHVDPMVNEVRGLGSVVGTHTTMTSIVLKPAEQRVYMANGKGPVSHNSYVEFPLAGTFTAEEFKNFKHSIIENNDFERQHPEKFSALKLFIEAKKAYEQENNHKLAYEIFKEIVNLDPSNPAYFFQKGIFALKNSEYREALQAFDKIFTCDYCTPQLKRLGFYYRGKTYAHLGQKQEALHDLRELLKDPDADKKLLSAARKAEWRTRVFGSTKVKGSQLMLMMQQTDMLNY